jgi:Kef-type K+ transport system membrane component KefB
MFMTGTEVRRVFNRDERRTVGAVFVTGMVLPFLAGIAVLRFINPHHLWGPNANATSFLLILAIAMAVTSIPV